MGVSQEKMSGMTLNKILFTTLIITAVCLSTPKILFLNAISTHKKHDEHKHYNHLVKEKSPYLLQHAKNPVDWYPWGSKAFEKALKENKPIFLSKSDIPLAIGAM